MTEQRLIDANDLYNKFIDGKSDTENEKDANQVARYLIRHAPTIDPETLPIVRQLREENEKLKQSFGNTFACDLMDKLDKAEKELARVTAERDAAVKCIVNKCRYIEDTERGPYCVLDDEPCYRCEGVWRCQKKEE